MDRHSVQDNVPEEKADDYRLVEAYGDRKYPKLVEQVASDVLPIRLQALTILCDEFNSPYGVYGCCVSGVTQIIAAMCADPNAKTRLLASRAVHLAARDSYGISSIIEEGGIPIIAKAMRDRHAEVRGNIYECMYQLSRTTGGVVACVNAGVSNALAKALADEDEALQPAMLRCLYNMSSLEAGLNDALDNNVVRLCIGFLASNTAMIRAEGARTLGFLCFSHRGNELAVTHGAVSEMAAVLAQFKDDVGILTSGSLCLMAVTSTDEGKRQLNGVNNAMDLVFYMMDSPVKVVNLNALKIISNIAVHPNMRNQLKRNELCVSRLQTLANGSDAFTKKHAQLAYDAIMWKP